MRYRVNNAIRTSHQRTRWAFSGLCRKTFIKPLPHVQISPQCSTIKHCFLFIVIDSAQTKADFMDIYCIYISHICMYIYIFVHADEQNR